MLGIGAGAAMLAIGAAGGATGAGLLRPEPVTYEADLAVTPIAELAAGDRVALNGKVVEIFGNKFVVEDGAARAGRDRARRRGRRPRRGGRARDRPRPFRRRLPARHRHPPRERRDRDPRAPASARPEARQALKGAGEGVRGSVDDPRAHDPHAPVRQTKPVPLPGVLKSLQGDVT